MKWGVTACLLLIFLSGCVTGSMIREAKEDRFDYTVAFCSESDCLSELVRMINSSESADCALYSANSEIVEVLSERKARLVLSSGSRINSSFTKNRPQGQMHNKFCVLDKKTVITGSFNPTSHKRSIDNMVIINSTALSHNYLTEFEEMWRGTFGKGKGTANSRLLLNNTLLENYFCPEDSCSERLLEQINQANKSIYFMTYSFTLSEVADSLLAKKESGLDVAGVIENTAQYSVYEQLKGKVYVKKHGNGLMHHKVFIIDNSTVITGSFNPTHNGDEKNDENLLIIHNPEVAEKYLNELNKLLM